MGDVEVVVLSDTADVSSSDLLDVLLAFRLRMEAVPRHASWLAYLRVPLRSTNDAAALAELKRKLEGNRGHWYLSTVLLDDERYVGMASEEFHPPTSGESWLLTFALSDIYTRLRAWNISHMWRANDLAEATYAHLAEWEIVSAAACCRALLEGIAAYSVEGEGLIASWQAFKKQGIPSREEVAKFQGDFGGKLLQAHFGSRLGERSRGRNGLSRTNILTLLKKFFDMLVENDNDHLWEHYEWLCDAVHPSSGFFSAYIAGMGTHRTRTSLAADLSHRVHISPIMNPEFRQDLALVIDDTLRLAIHRAFVTSSRLEWLVADFGLVTKAAYCYDSPMLGGVERLKRNEACYCGSGLKAKSCLHEWGGESRPPFTHDAS